MHAAKLIGRYERWCDRAVPFDLDARAAKHRRMAASAFAFLRGSYPVWLDRFRTDAAHDAPPVPLGAGDLHVENFATWLAAGGEVFGVNDYDETGPVPFTNDLTRLATSAVLAPAPRGQVRVDGATVVRRLDPDRGRIEISDLPHRRDGHALLWTMGYCTAAHHRLSADTDAFAKAFDASGLEHAARRMVSAVADDHAEFRKHVSADGHLHE